MRFTTSWRSRASSSSTALLALFLLVNATTLVLGCSTSDLEGTWEGSGIHGDSDVDLEITFDSDGTYSVSASGTCSDGTTECESEFSGTYTYNDTSTDLSFSLNCDSETLPDCCQCPTIEENSSALVWSTCDVVSTYYLGYSVSLSKNLDNTAQKIAVLALCLSVLVAVVMLAVAALFAVRHRRQKKKANKYDGMPEPSSAYE